MARKDPAPSSSLGGHSRGGLSKRGGGTARRDHRLREKLAVMDDDFVQWQVSKAQAKAAAAGKDVPPPRKRKGQLRPVSKQELEESMAALATLL